MMHPGIPKPFLRVAAVFVVLIYAAGFAEEPDDGEPGMNGDRLGELIQRVDAEAVQDGSSWYFHIEAYETAVIYDTSADRMRIIIPIADSEGLATAELQRMMQANFDSALDARYAIANGTLWSVFIHPLSSLTDEEFLVGLGQTVNVAESFGTSYSSGMFLYGAGDSAEIERQKLIEELKETM